MSCAAEVADTDWRRCALASARVRRRFSVGRRAQIDHALVLDRHERSAEIDDEALDVGEQLLGLIPGRDLDTDLVQRPSVETVLLQPLEEAIPVRNPRSRHLHHLWHARGVPGETGPETRYRPR